MYHTDPFSPQHPQERPARGTASLEYTDWNGSILGARSVPQSKKYQAVLNWTIPAESVYALYTNWTTPCKQSKTCTMCVRFNTRLHIPPKSGH